MQGDALPTCWSQWEKRPMDEERRIEILTWNFLKLQREVRAPDGTLIGYDPGTEGIKEINVNEGVFEGQVSVSVVFADGTEWIFNKIEGDT